MTDARHLALRVVAYADRAGREVRVSNRTTSPTEPWPTVYWQTARWLVDEGLAVDGLGDTRDGLHLTPAGRDLAAKLTVRTAP
jgi:hypothetical protein